MRTWEGVKSSISLSHCIVVHHTTYNTLHHPHLLKNDNYTKGRSNQDRSSSILSNDYSAGIDVAHTTMATEGRNDDEDDVLSLEDIFFDCDDINETHITGMKESEMVKQEKREPHEKSIMKVDAEVTKGMIVDGKIVMTTDKNLDLVENEMSEARIREVRMNEEKVAEMKAITESTKRVTEEKEKAEEELVRIRALTDAKKREMIIEVEELTV